MNTTVETIKRLNTWNIEDSDLRHVFEDFLENGGIWLRCGEGGPLMDRYLMEQGVALGESVLIYSHL